MYEPFDSPPKYPSGMTLHRKMFPSISGGRRVDTVNKELRVRLSRIMALSCSPICFSNASIESRLISRTILFEKPRQKVRNGIEVLLTHIDGDISLRLVGDWKPDADQWMREIKMCRKSHDVRPPICPISIGRPNLHKLRFCHQTPSNTCVCPKSRPCFLALHKS